jgi:hypothetical protein
MWGWEKGEEMAQTMYAHIINEFKKENKIK